MSSPTNPGSPSSKLPPFTRPKNPSPNVETVLKYIDALAALDPHSVIAQFDDRCMHHILPRSLGRPVLTKDQYLFYLVAIFKMFNSYQLAIHDITDSQGENKVVVHATYKATAPSAVSWANEILLTYHLVPPEDAQPQPADGLPKVILVKEFVDSQTTSQFFKQRREMIAKKHSA